VNNKEENSLRLLSGFRPRNLASVPLLCTPLMCGNTVGIVNAFEESHTAKSHLTLSLAARAGKKLPIT
jgi:hypothetical protein